MAKIPNLRKMTMSAGMGKVACESPALNGVAKPSKAFQEKNSTTQYTTGSMNKGPLGGMNTNS